MESFTFVAIKNENMNYITTHHHHHYSIESLGGRV